MEVYNAIDEVEEVELQLNTASKKFLLETAKWAYFLSILGYVGIGFIVLVAVFAGALFGLISNLSPELQNTGWISGSFISAFYLIIAVLYFFPVYYLNQFSSKLKLALKNDDSNTLASSFGYLKSHYKYIGIVVLITLCFYVLIFLGVIIVALTIGMNQTSF